MKKAKSSRPNEPKCLRKAVKQPYADGWLSPEGDYWPCRPQGHQELADYLSGSKSYDGEKILEGRGWIKVSTNKWYAIDIYVTQAQIDFVFDWCRVNDRKYPPDHLRYMLEDRERGLI